MSKRETLAQPSGNSREDEVWVGWYLTSRGGTKLRRWTARTNDVIAKDSLTTMVLGIQVRCLAFSLRPPPSFSHCPPLFIIMPCLGRLRASEWHLNGIIPRSRLPSSIALLMVRGHSTCFPKQLGSSHRQHTTMHPRLVDYLPGISWICTCRLAPLSVATTLDWLQPKTAATSATHMARPKCSRAPKPCPSSGSSAWKNGRGCTLHVNLLTHSPSPKAVC